MSRRRRFVASHIARLSVLALLLAAFPVLGAATGASAAPNFVQIDGGGSEVCGVTGGAGAECWGFGGWGALGNGDTDDRSLPTPVTGLSSGVAQVAAGFSFACALMDNGTVKCWGNNGTGALGNGMIGQDSYTPVDVSGITNATQIDAGDEHACAVLAGGTIQCWGYGAYYQLGNNDNQGSDVPVTVSGITDATQVATGGTHSCAIVGAGAMECWGHNQNDEIGDGGVHSPAQVPVAVTGLSSGVTEIAAHGVHTCALVSGGMKCWGSNSFGEAGTGLPASSYSTPQDVSGLTSGVDKIATGDSACAVSSGALQCWGRNFFGEVGNGTHGSGTDTNTPGPVSGLSSGVSDVTTAGGISACALMDDHSVKCWGTNGSGQLGNDDKPNDSDVPVDVVSAPPSADLQLSMTDSPDPVTSQNDVLFHLEVHNAGPDQADDVVLDVAPAGPFDLGSEPGSCTGGGEGQHVICDLDSIASGATAQVDIVMVAPEESSQVVLHSSASVSASTDDPTPANNDASQTTTVNPPDTGSGSGYVPPEGGSVSSGTKATTADPVALTMTLPPGGPGGAAKVSELANCKPFGATCVGVASNWVPPSGYGSITATLRYDKTIVPPGRVSAAATFKTLFKKGAGPKLTLPKCSVASNVPPCTKQAKVLPNQDLRVKVLINSDPKLATRR